MSQDTLNYIGGSLEARGPQATLADVLSTKDGLEILNRLISDGAVNVQEAAAYVAKGELTSAGRARINQALLGRFSATRSRSTPHLRRSKTRSCAWRLP
ncbi:MAG: hypothetical protein ABSH24_17575 [Bryobacteraceae bacterium]